MTRQQRRAAEHQARKLARKAGFPIPTPTTPNNEIPEAGRPLPLMADMTMPWTNPPISEAKLAANRANAQHSTGPKTEAGRAASSQNRTTHGLARHNGTFAVLPSEDPAGFEALLAGLIEEHQPTTQTEAILVNTMAESHWLAQRAFFWQQSDCCESTNGEILDSRKFLVYLRYQTTHTRAFHKCLNDLLKLKAARRKEEAADIKNEQHEMKKQKHYWEVLKKDGETCKRMMQNITHFSKATAENPGFEAQYNVELAKHGLARHRFGAAVSATKEAA